MVVAGAGALLREAMRPAFRLIHVARSPRQLDNRHVRARRERNAHAARQQPEADQLGVGVGLKLVDGFLPLLRGHSAHDEGVSGSNPHFEGSHYSELNPHWPTLPAPDSPARGLPDRA